MTLARVVALLAVLGAASCGGSPEATDGGASTGGGYTLQAAGGTYFTGAEPVGLNVLMTLRDASGAGPAEPWTVTIEPPGGGTPLEVVYDDASPGSFATWWWDPYDPPAGTYGVEAARDEIVLTTSFELDPSKILAQPILALDLDAAALSWSGADGARSYLCRVFDATGTVVVYTLTATASCGLPGLAPDTYRAEILAHSIDHLALAADRSPAPLEAPRAHSMAAADVVFTVPDAGGTGVVVRVAGGAITYGTARARTAHRRWATRCASGSPPSPGPSTWAAWCSDCSPGPPVTTPTAWSCSSSTRGTT